MSTIIIKGNSTAGLRLEITKLIFQIPHQALQQQSTYWVREKYDTLYLTFAHQCALTSIALSRCRITVGGLPLLCLGQPNLCWTYLKSKLSQERLLRSIQKHFIWHSSV